MRPSIKAPDCVAYKQSRTTITKSIGISVLIHFSKPSNIPLATTNMVTDKKSVCQKIKEEGLESKALKLEVELSGVISWKPLKTYETAHPAATL